MRACTHKLQICNRARRFRVLIALIDELGTEFITDTPGQAALPRMIGREDDGELRWNLEIFGDHLHATRRNIRNRAIARQRPRAAQDLCDPPAQATFTLPPIRIHIDSHHRCKLVRQHNSGEMFESAYREGSQCNCCLAIPFTKFIRRMPDTVAPHVAEACREGRRFSSPMKLRNSLQTQRSVHRVH